MSKHSRVVRHSRRHWTAVHRPGGLGIGGGSTCPIWHLETAVGTRMKERCGGKTSVEFRAGKLVGCLGMGLGVGRDWLVELGQSLEVKLVGVSLAVNLCHDVLVIIVAKGTTKLVVIHVGLVLSLSPASSDLIGV